MNEARQLYLDLMKKCLTCYLWGDKAAAFDAAYTKPALKRWIVQRLIRFFARRGLHLSRTVPFDPQARAEGKDWPASADTMIGLRRLDNIQICIERVLADDVPGDFIETGVWRGGAVIFMRAVLKAHGVTDRTVWAADSFEGLPEPSPDDYPADAGEQFIGYPELAVPIEEVQQNFARYGLLDDQVQFLKGWFKDTLPHAPFRRLAVMRLDGDMYESTMDALVHLYPKLSLGGFVIIDDYHAVPACRQAVDDFRAAQRIQEPIESIDWTGVYWRRRQPSPVPNGMHWNGAGARQHHSRTGGQ